jgi:hypothetical protein
MRNLFNRPLTDPERSLLCALATRVVADQTGCSHDEAGDALAAIAADGRLHISGDAERVDVEACGNVLVRCARDWLSFHSSYPGHDPMADEKRGADRVSRKE